VATYISHIADKRHGRFLNVLRHTDDSAGTVRTLLRVSSLVCHGAVQLGDARRIENGGINFRLVRAEPHIQNAEKIRDDLPVVGTRVNLEQEMIPIPAVCDNRLLEAHRHQLFHHCGRHFARRFLFRLGGADAAWSDRIGIHENPLISGNVVVAGGFSRTLHQMLVLSAGVTGGLHHLQGLIKGSVGKSRNLFRNGCAVRFEIAADDRLGINAANLNDVLRIVQQSQPFQRDIHFTASVLSSGLPKERQVSFCSHLTIPGM